MGKQSNKISGKFLRIFLALCVCIAFEMSMSSCCPASEKLAHNNDNTESEEKSDKNADETESSKQNNSNQKPAETQETEPDINLSTPKSAEETKTVGVITEATVTKISDGDTFYVSCYNTRIRLIGIDCPEAGTVAGDSATEYTKGSLPVGTHVWLEADITDCDKYGRPLRYVWTSNPGTIVTKSDCSAKMYNAQLLQVGHAVAKNYPPNTKYADWLDNL